MASTERGTTKEIPLLKDVGAAKREALFLQKVELCTTVYRFDNDVAIPGSPDTRGKEVKRQTLMELLDFVNTQVRFAFILGQYSTCLWPLHNLE